MRSVLTPRRATRTRTHTPRRRVNVLAGHSPARGDRQRQDQGTRRPQGQAQAVRAARAQLLDKLTEDNHRRGHAQHGPAHPRPAPGTPGTGSVPARHDSHLQPRDRDQTRENRPRTKPGPTRDARQPESAAGTIRSHGTPLPPDSSGAGSTFNPCKGCWAHPHLLHPGPHRCGKSTSSVLPQLWGAATERARGRSAPSPIGTAPNVRAPRPADRDSSLLAWQPCRMTVEPDTRSLHRRPRPDPPRTAGSPGPPKGGPRLPYDSQITSRSCFQPTTRAPW
jgi:hypothetical protein